MWFDSWPCSEACRKAPAAPDGHLWSIGLSDAFRCAFRKTYGGETHSHGGTPIAGWFISWKIAWKKWMIWGYPPISGNLHVVFSDNCCEAALFLVMERQHVCRGDNHTVPTLSQLTPLGEVRLMIGWIGMILDKTWWDFERGPGHRKYP
jgi:hypothetical protein